MSCEVAAVETNLATILCVYRPPNLSAFSADISNVLDIIAEEKKGCYTVGEFNIENSQGNWLIKNCIRILYSLCFHPMITGPLLFL